jgi:hypothetical protein
VLCAQADDATASAASAAAHKARPLGNAVGLSTSAPMNFADFQTPVVIALSSVDSALELKSTCG